MNHQSTSYIVKHHFLFAEAARDGAPVRDRARGKALDLDRLRTKNFQNSLRENIIATGRIIKPHVQYFVDIFLFVTRSVSCVQMRQFKFSRAEQNNLAPCEQPVILPDADSTDEAKPRQPSWERTMKWGELAPGEGALRTEE